ncbi:FtsK/SpoIIIE domain-containing protein [Cellulomonas fengjieae]|uniref:FtsK/SpoIIIE domain-containing protein n=1 Tax=Cellulomonas fengjieae TaxID=2819978 RepID=UPI0027DB509D|nr:FtsK/SpoIIIE domain-containing protein [Cellulomonas fengjieae]
MRLFLTAGPGPDGPWHDVAIDCDDDADVRAVAARLADLDVPSRAGAAVARVRDTGRRLGVVIDESEPVAATASGSVPRLFVGSLELDPAQPVAASALRNGALVGLGAPPALTLAEPTGVIEVRVVSGPGAGTVRRLGLGVHLVGPGAAASVRLEEPSPSVEIEVGSRGDVHVQPVAGTTDEPVPAPVRTRPLDGPIVVRRRGTEPSAPAVRRRRRRKSAVPDTPLPDHADVDPDAERAPVELDRLPLTTRSVWEPGTPLTVGASLLEVAVPTAPDASLSPSPTGATMDYNRPPRLLPPPRLTDFALPKEPSRPARQALPILVVIAPMIMGLAMFMITQRVQTLLFIALSPLLMIANWWQGRKTQGARYVDQVREYEERRARVEAAAFEALLEERAARRVDAADPAEVLLQATGPRSRLWERRALDADWLTVRIGTADQPSEVVLTDPAREKHQGTLVWTAPDVPVTISLLDSGVTGIAARDGLAQRIAQGLLGQVTTWHSPADVRVVLLTASQDADRWAWVRWLPHVRAGSSAGPIAAVGTDEETTARRVADLVALLEARREAADADRGLTRFESVLVVLDGARALRLLPGMVGLLRTGPSYGFTFLCLDSDVTLLPEECRTVVSSAYGALRVETTGRPMVEGVRADLVPDAWCERVARALAPVHDVSSAGAVSAVPRTSRLLSVLRIDPPTADTVAAGWARGGRTTSAIIGEIADGPFSVDLRTDGPHGLVAGTTGSGKSELLQTLIASLAVGNRPDEMTFVLIDYKGGAAFKDCAHLPHTVGMVTDLDGHLTSRALESLGAELRRREHQLADAGAKDIDDYLAARGPDDAPMPRLLIVIDEFAALVTELPDFVTGLVDIARRGRSLGTHLVLATQRPAGVVSAEIKSNTNLRIALRVTDPGDSQDVIESDVAAHIEPSLPGRAYARLGHAQLIPFQSSRVGGRPPGEGPASVSVRDLSWSTLGIPGPRVQAVDEEGIETPTDLATLVAAVTAATTQLGIPHQPSPWLAALPDVVLLDDLPIPPLERGRIPALPLGTADLPALQRQENATWDLVAGGHLAVIGQTRAGRSSALRLLAADIGLATSPLDVHLYGIDCGNGALLPLLTLPHTGAVVTRDQPDRLRRLLALLGREVSRRQQMLAAGGFADIIEQRTHAAPDDRLPYLVVMLDRWEGYVAAYEGSDGGIMIEQVVSLLREGVAVGLRAVLTGDRSMLVGRMGMALEDRIMLRMPSADDFSYVGMRQRDVPTRMPAGRAFRSGENAVEMQLALLDEDPSGTAQVAALQRIAATARDAAGPIPAPLRPARVDELPPALTWSDALELRDEAASPGRLLVGVGGDSLSVREHDVDMDGPGYLVVGPQRSGRSTALLATLTDALEARWQVTVVAPRRSPLRDLAGRPGIRAVLTADSTADELKAALDTRGRRLLVIDDFEVLGGEHALSVVADDYLKQIRDSGDAIAVACGIDEVSGMYRGVTATLRKSRGGLILAPRSAADGDILGSRLPRSIGAAVPVGRGIRVRSGAWEWVQVPRPPDP